VSMPTFDELLTNDRLYMPVAEVHVDTGPMSPYAAKEWLCKARIITMGTSPARIHPTFQHMAELADRFHV